MRRRINVNKRVVGFTHPSSPHGLGNQPITILRVTYNDGAKTINVSTPGSLALFGRDFAHAKRYIRVMMAQH